MRYAVAKKGCWWVVMTCASREEAEKFIKGKEFSYEIREIIDTPKRRKR